MCRGETEKARHQDREAPETDAAAVEVGLRVGEPDRVPEVAKGLANKEETK